MSNILPHGRNLQVSEINRVENFQGWSQEIADSIEFNPILERVTFDVELNVDDERIVRSVRNAVFRNSHIKTLIFYRVRIAPKTVGWGLRQMKNLAKIQFWGSEIAEVDQPAFVQMLQIQGRKLQEIELCAVEIGDICAQAIGQSLRFRSPLKSITIVSCGLSEAGFIALGEALQYYSSLANLELVQSGIVLDTGAGVWAKTIERNISLESLIIRVDRVPAARSTRLLEALTTNKTLREVYLEGLELGREGSLAVALLIEQNDTIEMLELTGTFDHEVENMDTFYAVGLDLAPIAQALVGNLTLKTICFDAWAIRTDDLQSVCDHGQHNKTLEELHLDGCRINAEEMVPLCRFLSQYIVLKALHLSGCKIEDDATFVLCKGLEQNESVESLILSRNQIGDIGASVLADFLSGNETLETLDVYDNNIADAGFASLGRALECNNVLNSLELEKNDNVSENDVSALLDGIRVHPALIHVSLPDKASDLQKNELHFYLERNAHVWPLLSISMPAGLWPQALKRADECCRDEERYISRAPDMLYFLVKEKFQELFHNVPVSRKRKHGRR